MHSALGEFQKNLPSMSNWALPILILQCYCCALIILLEYCQLSSSKVPPSLLTRPLWRFPAHGDCNCIVYNRGGGTFKQIHLLLHMNATRGSALLHAIGFFHSLCAWSPRHALVPIISFMVTLFQSLMVSCHVLIGSESSRPEQLGIRQCYDKTSKAPSRLELV